MRETHLVRNVQRIVIGRQADVRLLFAVGTAVRMRNQRVSLHIGEDSPDEGVDLRSLDVVELLHCVLDLTLVRPDVSDEDEGVVLLNLLHRRLRVQWPIITRLLNGRKRSAANYDSRNNRPELVHTGGMGDGFAGVLGGAGKAEGLGAVEGDGGAHFARGVCVGAVERSLFRGLGLRILARRYEV